LHSRCPLLHPYSKSNVYERHEDAIQGLDLKELLCRPIEKCCYWFLQIQEYLCFSVTLLDMAVSTLNFYRVLFSKDYEMVNRHPQRKLHTTAGRKRRKTFLLG